MGVLFVSTLLIALLPVLSTGLLQLVLGPPGSTLSRPVFPLKAIFLTV